MRMSIRKLAQAVESAWFKSPKERGTKRNIADDWREGQRVWLPQAEFRFYNETSFVIRFGEESRITIDLKTGDARRNGLVLPRKRQ